MAAEAQLAAEAKAAEEARIAAEEQAAEEARAAEAAKLAAEAQLATDEQVAGIEVEQVPSEYERLRDQELSVLAGLSARLRFENRSQVVSGDVEASLDRLFEPLFLYPEMSVRLFVATNEFRSPEDDVRLSQERGRSIVRYLIDRGLELSRFSLETFDGEGLPYGSHRVRVLVEEQQQ